MIRCFEVIKGLDGREYIYKNETVLLTNKMEQNNLFNQLIIGFKDGYQQPVIMVDNHQQVPDNNITEYLNNIKKKIEIAIDTRQKLRMLPDYINEVFGNETNTTTTTLIN